MTAMPGFLQRIAVAGLLACWPFVQVLAAPGATAGKPEQWLERMADALDQLNYEGTLVQRVGNDAAVMRVVHRVENGQVTERITALDEVGREIIRQREKVTCILPDQKSVLVQPREGESDGRSPLRRQLAGNRDYGGSNYRLASEPGGRLVGRETELLLIRPTDTYRYGYRLWLDRATAMPLKVQVVDGQGVVEQLVFSEIDLGELISAESVQPSIAVDQFTLKQADPAKVSSPRPAPVSASWRAEFLPPGFALRTVRMRQTGAGEEAVQHLVYSDGVASISVFIEREANASRRSEGVSSMGAANAFTLVRGDDLVTAVGEVPVQSVEKIARSMQPIAAP